MRLLLSLGALLLGTLPAIAGESHVVRVEAELEPAGTWRFKVTATHEDKGWDHYLDLWEIVAPDGTVLGKRVLLHPHDNEQPFTRALGGVEVPARVEEVIVRAHCNVHAYGGRDFRLKIPR